VYFISTVHIVHELHLSGAWCRFEIPPLLTIVGGAIVLFTLLVFFSVSLHEEHASTPSSGVSEASQNSASPVAKQPLPSVQSGQVAAPSVSSAVVELELAQTERSAAEADSRFV
jgi:hypothetical protein